FRRFDSDLWASTGHDRVNIFMNSFPSVRTFAFPPRRSPVLAVLFLSSVPFRCPPCLHQSGQFLPSRRGQSTDVALLWLLWGCLTHRGIPALHTFRNSSPRFRAHRFLLRWTIATDCTAGSWSPLVKLASDLRNFVVNALSFGF